MSKLKEWKAQRLLKAFNAAAPVMDGLNALKAAPGSIFDYTISTRGSNVVLTTNIPADYPSRDKVIVTSTGYRLIANGDFIPYSRTGMVSDSALARNKNPQKIVDFVARYAAKRGLVS